jgi:DTW domain-containing protein YfiP
MAREVCTQCEFPVSTCLCDVIQPIHCETKFDIIQHPSEVSAAKNTARLCKLCMKNVRIWVGEQPDDFHHLRQELAASSNTAVSVLYPSDQSMTVAHYQEATRNVDSHRLIVLDGTWKKAYKLWQLNTWLHDYPAIRLEDVASNYHIRKSPKPGGVSTLEAIAAILNELEPTVDSQPLMSIFEARQAHFSRRN